MIKILLLISFIPSLIFAGTSSSKCPGETGYFYTNNKSKRNPRKGGFVSDSANVSDFVFIARTAAVCGSSSVLKSARVYGNAIIKDEAEITDHARVYGNAIVKDEALIGGNATVSGHAIISKAAIIRGNAKVKGYKKISKGILTKGTYTAEKSALAKIRDQRKKRRINAKKKAAQEKRLQEDMLFNFQMHLDQGWYGNNKKKGFYRNFTFKKGEIKIPCGFYLKVRKEEKTLESHCRKTKRVKRTFWTSKQGKWKYLKDCPTEYDDQGEVYFDLRKLQISTYNDYYNKRNYLELNHYYFYIGNNRKINHLKKRIIKFARTYCGYKH